MAYVITGLYSDQATGLAAEAAALKHFDDDEVTLIAGPGDEAKLAALIGNGLTQAEASAFAGAISNGGAVVSVRAGFGRANLATHTLTKLKPAALRSVSIRDEQDGDNASPFSDLFGWKLLSDSAAPFSAFFGLNPSMKSKPLNVKLIDKAPKVKLIDKAPKVKLMSNSPAPFSAMFKLPVLSKGR